MGHMTRIMWPIILVIIFVSVDACRASLMIDHDIIMMGVRA